MCLAFPMHGDDKSCHFQYVFESKYGKSMHIILYETQLRFALPRIYY